MGRILKQGDFYFVEFFGNGLRFQKKAGTTQEEAEAKLKKIEQSVEASALDVSLATVTVDMFVERYIAFAREVHSAVTWTRYKEALAHFQKFLKTHLPDPGYMKAVTPRVLEEYKALLIQKAAARDVNLTLFLIRDILEYARSLRFLNDNPTQHLQFLKEGFDSSMELLDEKEGGLPEPEQKVYQFVLATGICKEECQSLKWEDIDFEHKRVWVGSKEKSRAIPLEPSLLSQLQGEVQGLDPQDFIFSDIQWSIIPFQKLQNTFAKNLLTRGVPLIRLNQFLGFDDVADVYPFGVFMV